MRPLTHAGLRTTGAVRSYSLPSFIQTGMGKFRVTPDMDGGFRGEFLKDCALPALPQKHAMCLLVALDNGWRRLETCQNMVSLKAWWKMITFHSPKSFLLNYQFPLTKAGPGSIGFRMGLFLMEGQFYPGICSFESVPTVWFAVMNLLINELLYSISNKLYNIGMRGNSKIDLTSI